jgi:cell division protein FtsN
MLFIQMTEKRQRLFIYDRKEVLVLLLLAVMVTLFAFTLGLHMGKRVVTKTVHTGAAPVDPAETNPDAIPNRQELTEQAKNAPEAVEESLDQELHNEVARNGLKMEVPRQVDLPKETKSEKHAAPTAIAAAKRHAPSGRYTLQVGSYADLKQAREQVDALEAAGIEPLLRSIQIKGKGTWYRIYLGGFNTKEEAEKAGARFRESHMIDSFIISNMIE